MARSQRTDLDAPAPAKSDAYVGLLLISLLAQVVGAALFYLDWNQYGESKPKLPPAATVPAGGGAPPPVGGGPAGLPPPVMPK
jgi:hypothetical protein